MDDNATKAHAAQIEKIENWNRRNNRVIHTRSAANAWDKLNHQYEGREH